MARINDLGRDRIGPLLWRLVVPATTAQLVNALYNIVDQIFIGQGIGYLGIGATNIIFPITIVSVSYTHLINFISRIHPIRMRATGLG